MSDSTRVGMWFEHPMRKSYTSSQHPNANLKFKKGRQTKISKPQKTAFD